MFFIASQIDSNKNHRSFGNRRIRNRPGLNIICCWQKQKAKLACVRVVAVSVLSVLSLVSCLWLINCLYLLSYPDQPGPEVSGGVGESGRERFLAAGEIGQNLARILPLQGQNIVESLKKNVVSVLGSYLISVWKAQPGNVCLEKFKYLISSLRTQRPRELTSGFILSLFL